MNLSPDRIINIANAYFDSCVLFAAVEMGLFAELEKAGTSNGASLAKSLGLDPTATIRLLDSCVALNLVRKDKIGYSLTEESKIFLAPNSHADISGALRYNRDVYSAWGRLSDYVRTGKPVEDPRLHLGEDEERTRGFVYSMHRRALGIGRVVVPQLPLHENSRILDVGGGPGTFSMMIAQRFAGCESIVVDLPAVSAIGKQIVKDSGMHDRVSYLPGDYHTIAFPSGRDAVLFLGVLHQESAESICGLFSKAFEALYPGGIIVVMDVMTDETRCAPKFSTMFSLNMALTTNNGWVFSDNDLKSWLHQSGFEEFRIKPAGGAMPHWIATARRPTERQHL